MEPRTANEVYVIEWSQTNPAWADLDAANVADGHYAKRRTPELLEKAEKLMRHFMALAAEVYEQAEQQQFNPWDELKAIPDQRAIKAYELIKQKYNGAVDCECAPDGSTTCRLCQEEAWVRHQYQTLFEED